MATILEVLSMYKENQKIFRIKQNAPDDAFCVCMTSVHESLAYVHWTV